MQFIKNNNFDSYLQAVMEIRDRAMVHLSEEVKEDMEQAEEFSRSWEIKVPTIKIIKVEVKEELLGKEVTEVEILIMMGEREAKYKETGKEQITIRNNNIQIDHNLIR